MTSLSHACDLLFTVNALFWITLWGALGTFLSGIFCFVHKWMHVHFCCALAVHVEIVDPPLFSYLSCWQLLTMTKEWCHVFFFFLPPFLASFCSLGVEYFSVSSLRKWVCSSFLIVRMFVCIWCVTCISCWMMLMCACVERSIAATCNEFRVCVRVHCHWESRRSVRSSKCRSSHPHMPINTFTFFYNVWKEKKKEAKMCAWPFFSPSPGTYRVWAFTASIAVTLWS